MAKKYLEETKTAPVPGGRKQNDYAASERPCLAHQCPELGTITESMHAGEGTKWFCRHHYEARQHPERWPEISERLRLEPKAKPVDPAGRYAGWTPDQCRAEIALLMAGGSGALVAGSFRRIGAANVDPKEWARVLRVREECGDHLSPAQRQAWRDALGVRDAG